MKTENLSTLKIHKLSQAQYKRELEANNIDENALYLTPDEDIEYIQAYTDSDGNWVLSNNHTFETVEALVLARRPPIIYINYTSGAKRYFYFNMRYANSDGTYPLEFHCSYNNYGYMFKVHPSGEHTLTYYTWVTTGRTINGKKLSSNITLTASDIGTYSDEEIDAAIETHNTSSSAHADIRAMITSLDKDIPEASNTEAGITKLYDEVGNNTDGAITQNAATENFVNREELEEVGILEVAGGTSGQVLTKTNDGLAFMTPNIPHSVLVTLTSSGWSSLTQTVTVNGISADEGAQLIMPVPQMTSSSAYNSAGIRLTAQAENSLTFTASTAPSADINVYIVYQELS